jgi:Tfp pilus assembly protein PilF
MMSRSAKAIRYALSGALAIGLLAGCAGSSHLARAGNYAARPSGKVNHAVDLAEKAVERSPNDAATRVALGQAYLDAGRFQSAATTFGDAVALGDTSGRTQLSLALAQIGAGDLQAAVEVLDGATRFPRATVASPWRWPVRRTAAWESSSMPCVAARTLRKYARISPMPSRSTGAGARPG